MQPPPSLRFVYIQLRGGGDDAACTELRACVARLGRVRGEGRAPETDATGVWFELALRTPVRDLAHLRKRLRRVSIAEAQVYSVRAVVPGEGAAQAKQRELFGRPP